LTPNLWEDGNEERYLNVAQQILDNDSLTVNSTAGYLGTPLTAAAVGGSVAMVELLLRHSPNLDLKAGSYGTPVHAAASRGRLRVIELLFDTTPAFSPATTDAGGRLPVHTAAVNDGDNLVAILTLPDISVLNRDLEGRHSLHFVAGKGSVNFARTILAKYPEAIDDFDEDGWTPLHWACREGSIDMINLLLSHEADKYAETKRGWRPIHVAIYRGFKAEVMDRSRLILLTAVRESYSPSPKPNWHKNRRKYRRTRRRCLSDDYGDYDCDSCDCVSALPRAGAKTCCGGC
jgi:hypothetical protein